MPYEIKPSSVKQSWDSPRPEGFFGRNFKPISASDAYFIIIEIFVDASSFHTIKTATTLEVIRYPKTQSAFHAFFLHNVIRETKACLKLLENNHGWLKTFKLFGCMDMFRLG